MNWDTWLEMRGAYSERCTNDWMDDECEEEEDCDV